MKQTTRVAVALCALLFSTGALANAREQLTAFTKGLTGLDARFDQRV